MTTTFQKASKRKSKARVAIDGPSGAGKTYTALIAATVLAEGGRIAVIDTEHGSASLYSDEFNFDVLELTNFNPNNYIDSIEAAEQEGYAVVVIDSLSHAWEGEGGALEMVDDATKRSKSGNSYTAWRDVTPVQRRMIDAMLASKCHVIATMRSKMEYVQEKDERTGKTVIRKVGLAPVQRSGTEYEFGIVADMDIDHNLVVSKSRCKALADKVENRPGPKFWKTFLDWLNSGDAAPAPSAPESLSAESSSHRKEEPGQLEHSVDAPLVRARQTFGFSYRGQTERVEYQDANAVIGTALATEPLKGWFGSVIVKSFEAEKHYRNHLQAHFGVTSAASLTWKMLEALRDHVVEKKPYSAEYNPTPEKPAAKNGKLENGKLEDEISAAGLTELVGQIMADNKGKALPEQAVRDAIQGLKQNIYNLSDPDDKKTITNTILEAL
jgi:hypothetical protein